MFTNHTDTKDLRAAIARERDSKARQLNAEEWAARAGTSPHEVRTIVLGDDVFVPAPGAEEARRAGLRSRAVPASPARSTPTAAAPAAPTRAPATAAKPATDTAAPARSTPVPPVRDDRTREERRVDALLDADLHDERSHFQRSRDEAADEKRAREAFAAKRVAADGADLVKTLRDDLAGAAREGGAQ